jgi:hypothetical protein
MDFDVVIPLGPNEVKNIQTQINHVIKFVEGFRRIFVISYDANIVLDGCLVISEDIFPFKMQDIADYFSKHLGKSNRNGWYLQQLLKLYAGQVIPDILSNYLVIDSDVVFLKPVSFFNEHNGCSKYCFTIDEEYHPPYFEHMLRLHPTFNKIIFHTGIVHHMMFSTVYVKEMMEMVETFHNVGECVRPFWKIFIESVREHLKFVPTHIDSGASEYELYFNYMLQFHRDLVHLRILNWDNVRYDYDLINNENNELFDYIAVSSWYI